MGRVVYWLNMSLDGFIETRDKSPAWAAPSQEVFQHFIDEGRRAAMILLGRRMYELMAAHWPTADKLPGATEPAKEYSRMWTEKPKVVFSRSHRDVAWNSRLVTRDIAREVIALKQQVDGDMWLGGPSLAATFIEHGLVDEYRLHVWPVVLGGGTPFFPPVPRRVDLRLLEKPHTFADGVVKLRYELAARRPQKLLRAVTSKTARIADTP
jgi:dihydrofolate reductase